MSAKRWFYKILGTKVRPIELASVIKSSLFINRRFYQANGFFWFLDPVSDFGLRLIIDGKYEPDFSRKILSLLEEGDKFIDLGGNEGYFSILASRKVGPNGHVYCIEPQGRLHSVIMKNISKNHLYNISLMPFAVADKVEEVEITLSPTINTGSSTFVNENRRALWKKEKIQTTTLDNLFYHRKIERYKLLKIDIEGFEYFALKGGEGLLEKQLIENIIIEIHPDQLKKLGHNEKMIQDLLSKYGYSKSDGVYKLASRN